MRLLLEVTRYFISGFSDYWHLKVLSVLPQLGHGVLGGAAQPLAGLSLHREQTSSLITELL